MTSLAHKMRSAGFYMKRPAFWAHFAHRGLGYVRADLDGAGFQAAGLAWARAQALPPQEALARIRLIVPPGEPLPALPRQIWNDARQRVAQAPCKMGGGGDVDLIYAVTRLSRARAVLETGVAFGWSSLAFLTAITQGGSGGHLVSVDRPYPGDGSEAFVGIAVEPGLRKQWRIVREPDRNGLRRAIAHFPHGVDLAHYDSDKTYRGRWFGYHAIWEALKPGGVFMSDDIQDNMAFAHFVARMPAPFGVVESQGKFVGLAIKPG